VLTPEFEEPDWATPMVPPVEPPPGVELPHTWIQIIPAAPATAATFSIAATKVSTPIGADTKRVLAPMLLIRSTFGSAVDHAQQTTAT
jgi:hypothetical protein